MSVLVLAYDSEEARKASDRAHSKAIIIAVSCHDLEEMRNPDEIHVWRAFYTETEKRLRGFEAAWEHLGGSFTETMVGGMPALNYFDEDGRLVTDFYY